MQMIDDQVAASWMRGMDRYTLYGESLNRRIEVKGAKHLSLKQEAAFLFHDKIVPPLQELSTPQPLSDCAALDQAVAERFAIPMYERAYRVTGPILINPKRRRVTVKGRVFRSAWLDGHPKAQNNYHLLRDKFRSRIGRIDKIATALFVTHPYGHIYFHCLHDVLTQVVLANKLGVPKDVPVVINARLARSATWSYLRTIPLLAEREIIVMEQGNLLRCETMYLMRPQQFCRAYLSEIAQSIPAKAPAQDVGPLIALIRGEDINCARPLKNYQELVADLKARGYSAIDPATLSIPEQKWVFSRARHIVAENGSALTNIIFRGDQKVEVDALMASTFPSVTFQALSKACGVHYKAHVLPSSRLRGDFHCALTAQAKTAIIAKAQRLQKEI